MYGIDGLAYYPNFLTAAAHDTLVQQIEAAAWASPPPRRTQHYGYVCAGQAARLDPALYLGPLPPWLDRVAQRAWREGCCAVLADQATVMEYLPGQGVASHIDCPASFGETVFSLSLLSTVLVDFTRTWERVPVFVEPRSLLVLRGEARYEWSHGIGERQDDVVNGRRVWRARRLSVTFRTVVTRDR